MEERQHRTNPKNETLVSWLEIVLTKNNFKFNGENYLQIGGTAIGTRVAPSYANLFMHKLEEELIESYPLKPKIWLRYIDDVFFIWEHGLKEMNKWVTHLNNAHLSIKFTCEHSFKEIHFLDKVDQSQSLYTVFLLCKSDSHNYLLYSSVHPKCTI